jgi:hypothetical protein
MEAEIGMEVETTETAIAMPCNDVNAICPPLGAAEASRAALL